MIADLYKLEPNVLTDRRGQIYLSRYLSETKLPRGIACGQENFSTTFKADIETKLGKSIEPFWKLPGRVISQTCQSH